MHLLFDQQAKSGQWTIVICYKRQHTLDVLACVDAETSNKQTNAAFLTLFMYNRSDFVACNSQHCQVYESYAVLLKVIIKVLPGVGLQHSSASCVPREIFLPTKHSVGQVNSLLFFTFLSGYVILSSTVTNQHKILNSTFMSRILGAITSAAFKCRAKKGAEMDNFWPLSRTFYAHDCDYLKNGTMECFISSQSINQSINLWGAAIHDVRSAIKCHTVYDRVHMSK